jgi:hypothetical protein
MVNTGHDLSFSRVAKPRIPPTLNPIAAQMQAICKNPAHDPFFDED